MTLFDVFGTTDLLLTVFSFAVPMFLMGVTVCLRESLELSTILWNLIVACLTFSSAIAMFLEDVIQIVDTVG